MKIFMCNKVYDFLLVQQKDFILKIHSQNLQSKNTWFCLYNIQRLKHSFNRIKLYSKTFE